MPTFRTLLSGGELFGVGARAAGYTHIDGYEIDPKIAAVACLNGFDVHTADICDVDYANLTPADHLHASTVCTRASQANVGAVETDDDLAMADAVCRAITAHQGATFSLENVWAYRTFESFDRILAALKACGFVSDYRHVNAADYGVPQTRKRLILRAVRGRDRGPPLHPTHRQYGDMFHPPWVGWYAAIADILHTLPETTPAPWQLARMPKELRESTLFPSRMSHDQHGNCYGPQSRGQDEPAQTLSTMTATPNAEGRMRAYLLDGDNASRQNGKPTLRAADEPAMTVRGSPTPAHRAYTAGRWVRMTVQALGRFQTVPDSYQGLTAQINGVACLLAQRIMESLRGCYDSIS